jgi:mutator protein MutT
VPGLPDGDELPGVSLDGEQLETMITMIVSAAVIERGGAFLVTRRQEGAHLAGYWEFPGGKCEPAETLGGCLARELREELGAEAIIGDELLQTTHEYAECRVELHFVRCQLIGTPTPQLGQQMRWVSRDELGQLRFPPGDAELIRLLAGQGRRKPRRTPTAER